MHHRPDKPQGNCTPPRADYLTTVVSSTTSGADVSYAWRIEPSLGSRNSSGLFPLGLAGPVLVVDMTSPEAAGAAGSYRVTLACATDGAGDAAASASLNVQVPYFLPFLQVVSVILAHPLNIFWLTPTLVAHSIRTPQVNPPPSGGACIACLVSAGTVFGTTCSKTGKALTDIFRLACTGWADADLPLQYRFGFSAAPATNAGDGAAAGGAGGGGGAWFAFSREAKIDLVLAAGEFDALSVVRRVRHGSSNRGEATFVVQ
jgi:hypothetical protein